MIFKYLIGDIKNLDVQVLNFLNLSNGPTCNIYYDGRIDTARNFFDHQKRYYKASAGKLLTPGEYGCQKSHMLCYEKISVSDSFGLILEDDVKIFNESYLYKIDEIASNIGKNSVCILGHHVGHTDFKFFPKNGIYKVKESAEIWGTFSYLIGSEAACKILDLQSRSAFRADDWLLFRNKLNIEIYFASIFFHPPDLNIVMSKERLDVNLSFKKIFIIKFIKLFNKIFISIRDFLTNKKKFSLVKNF